jgi:hypothetical protein
MLRHAIPITPKNKKTMFKNIALAIVKFVLIKTKTAAKAAVTASPKLQAL